MSIRNKTTIEISQQNWQELNSRKEKPGESFDDVVDRLLE